MAAKKRQKRTTRPIFQEIRRSVSVAEGSAKLQERLDVEAALEKAIDIFLEELAQQQPAPGLASLIGAKGSFSPEFWARQRARLRPLEDECLAWHRGNETLLSEIFTDGSQLEWYRKSLTVVVEGDSVRKDAELLLDRMRGRCRKIAEIKQRFAAVPGPDEIL